LLKKENNTLVTKKRILLSPLDWGLGHATRCIPIVKQLLENKNFEIIIGADKFTLAILKEEFPSLEIIKLRGYNVKYYKNISIPFSIFLQIPKIIAAILFEHFWLKKTISKHAIDLVISDNRYGLYCRTIPAIFITHQVFIVSPYFEKIIESINHWFIKKYTQCWIPDFDDAVYNLSGKLSHGKNLPENCIYIDPQSRFSESIISKNILYDIAIVVSGPENERTNFENYLLELLKNTILKIVFVRGLKNELKVLKQGNITFFNYCSSTELFEILKASKIIIAKSGYSTVMDLQAMGKQAILFPTKGQSEQEYLAAYLLEKKFFYTCNKSEFNLEKALTGVKNYLPAKKQSRKICNALVIDLLADKIAK
jgi:uncharacterized protein (TIGR00661 family)